MTYEKIIDTERFYATRKFSGSNYVSFCFGIKHEPKKDSGHIVLMSGLEVHNRQFSGGNAVIVSGSCGLPLVSGSILLLSLN